MDEQIIRQFIAKGKKHWWFVGRRKILSTMMRDALKVGTARRILDVGCGAGANLAMLTEYGQVSGLEPDSDLSKFAADNNPEITIIHQSILSPIKESFDVICMFDVLEHIEDDAAAVQWISEILTKDGSFFVAVPAYKAFWSKDDELSHHFRRYTPKMLSDVLGSRFQIIRMSHYNILLSPIIFFIISLRKIFNIDNGGDFEKGSEGIINDVLKLIFCSEAQWLRWFDIPFGVSLYVECRKSELIKGDT